MTHKSGTYITLDQLRKELWVGSQLTCIIRGALTVQWSGSFGDRSLSSTTWPLKKNSREVVQRPNESSHDKVFWKLSAGTAHLLRKFSTFEVSLDDSRTTQRIDEDCDILPGYATINVYECIGDECQPKEIG